MSKVSSRTIGFAIIAGLLAAVVGLSLYKTFQPVHHGKAQTHPAQSATCATLSNGTKLCTTSTPVETLAGQLLRCISQTGGTRTAASQCINGMLAAFKSDGATQSDAIAVAKLVIARATQK